MKPIPLTARPRITTGKAMPIKGLSITGCAFPSDARNFHNIAIAARIDAAPIASPTMHFLCARVVHITFQNTMAVSTSIITIQPIA